MKSTRLIPLALLLFLFTSFVYADGGAWWYDTDHSQMVLHGENTQIAAINYEDGKEKLLLAVKMDQAAENDIMWIVPIPAEPNETEINIFEQFPTFSGIDPTINLRSNLSVIPAIAILTQIYTFPLALILLVVPMGAAFGDGKGDFGGVEVFQHIEKEGIVSELVTAESSDALYNYLRGEGLDISAGAIPKIDEYIGEDVGGHTGEHYSFVVSWIKAGQITSEKHPAIFIEFPTEKMFYPLKLTSIYGDRGLPVILYVVGYANPNLYDEIKAYTAVSYFKGDISGSGAWFKEFYPNAVQEPSYSAMETEDRYVADNVIYTRILILNGQDYYMPYEDYSTMVGIVPASAFVEDLTIEQASAPLSVIVADFLSSNILLVILLWLAGSSALVGFISGRIIFGRADKKFALIGLANCLTIVALIIATVFATKKEKGSKALFVFLFSGLYVIINFASVLIFTLIPI